MNLKTTVTTSLLLLAISPLYASVEQCCYEASQVTGGQSAICDTETVIAKRLGDNLSGQIWTPFGISMRTKELPIPGETTITDAIQPIDNKQNVGYVISPKKDTSLRAVIPAFKYESASTGTQCVSVKYSKIDSTYQRFNALESTDLRRTSGASSNSCLISINNLQGLLSNAYVSQLKTRLEQNNIHLLDYDQADGAQVTVSIPVNNLSFIGYQYDVNSQETKPLFSNKRTIKVDTKVRFDYGSRGSRSVNVNVSYNKDDIRNADHLDLVVIQNTILQSLDINACRHL